MKTNTLYQEKTKEELVALLSEKDQQIDALTELLRIHRYRQFGNKSEKISADQLSIFNEADLPKNVAAIVAAEEEIQVASYMRKQSPGRKPLPANLPREQRIYDLQDDEKICLCGYMLSHITDETSEQLEIIPAKVYVIAHVRKKYACK